MDKIWREREMQREIKGATNMWIVLVKEKEMEMKCGYPCVFVRERKRGGLRVTVRKRGG